MEEDYVTYEQALKLKKLGFNWECAYYYIKFIGNGEIKFWWQNPPINHNERTSRNEVCSAPTLHIAHKWIREHLNHYINVFPVCDYSDDADGRRCAEWNFWTFDIMNIGSGEIVEDDDGEYETYELALSAGIDKVFEIFEECL